MKKLKKANLMAFDTVEAFACTSCGCPTCGTCSCQGDYTAKYEVNVDDYRLERRTDRKLEAVENG